MLVLYNYCIIHYSIFVIRFHGGRGGGRGRNICLPDFFLSFFTASVHKDVFFFLSYFLPSCKKERRFINILGVRITYLKYSLDNNYLNC